MTTEILTLEQFSPLVGEKFSFADASPDMPDLVLTEAVASPSYGRPESVRAPFSLVFDLSDGPLLPQAIYRLRHPDFGEIDIFLVPMAKADTTIRYCATFN